SFVSVNYATADGNATAPSDYVAAQGTVFFPPGITTQTLTVLINGDRTFETSDPDHPMDPTMRFENFFVNLSNPVNASIVTGQGTVKIDDDDPVPTLSINDVSVFEGNAGTTNAVFTVSLSAASSVPVNVMVSTQDGTALAGPSPIPGDNTGNDYNSSSLILTFMPGETAKAFTVSVNGDTSTEFDEIFLVNLSAPPTSTGLSLNATIADPQGVGTIINDDAPPILKISDGS